MANQFPKGESGNPHGRPKGARNKASRTIRDIAQRLLEDRVYLKNLKTRMRAGTAPSLEILMFHFAYGKPVSLVATVNPDGSASAPGEDTAELVALIADLRIWLGQQDEVAPEPGKKLQ